MTDYTSNTVLFMGRLDERKSPNVLCVLRLALFLRIQMPDLFSAEMVMCVHTRS